MSTACKYPLSLNSDTFNSMKTDFDKMLRGLLMEMEHLESEDATITVKVGVHLEKDQARDFRITAYEAMRNITKPTFKHEINTVLQVKDKKSGSFGGNMELVWDKDLHDYMLREIDNGQLNLFDRNEENDVGAGSGDPALPAGDNGIIGTDYEVVSDSPAEEWEKDAPEPEDGSDGHHADPKVLFEYMKQFIGAEMKVLESMGQYTVSTLDNKVVLSSACQPTTALRKLQ